MKVVLPDNQNLAEHALAAGFATVEEYLLKLVELDVQQREARPASTDPVQQSAEEWIRDLRAFVQTIPPSNPNFDDSRESIYPVR